MQQSYPMMGCKMIVTFRSGTSQRTAAPGSHSMDLMSASETPSLLFRQCAPLCTIAHFSSLCYYLHIMLTKTQKKLIDILRAELTGTWNADISGLSDQELATIYRLAEAHNLSSMAGDYMSRHGVMNKVILRDMAYAQQKVEAMDRVFAEITEALSESGIHFLPLKGIVIRKLYPRPWMRLSGDIDILIKEADKKRIYDIFTNQLQYRLESTLDEDHFITKEGISIDISTQLRAPLSMDPDGILFSDIWNYADTAKIPAELDDAMLYAVTIGHIAKHLPQGGCGINHVMDVWVLNHTGSLTEDQRQKRENIIKEKHLDKLEKAIRMLSEKWFSNTDARYDTELEEYILSGAAHGTIGNKVSANSAGQKKSRYLFTRIFEPYDYLITLFPELKGKKWLTPYYEVKRWIIRLKSGRSLIQKKYL